MAWPIGSLFVVVGLSLTGRSIALPTQPVGSCAFSIEILFIHYTYVERVTLNSIGRKDNRLFSI